MKNHSQTYLGLAIITLGILFLIGNLTGINVWAICWPALFIMLGIWFIFRPTMSGPDARQTAMFVGEIERDGPWEVMNEEFMAFVMDVELDLTQAIIPSGETIIKVFGFVNDIELRVPAEVGIAIVPAGLVSSIKINGKEEDHFLVPATIQTENYSSAKRAIRLESYALVNEVKVRQVTV